MTRRRHTEEQIIAVLKDAQAGSICTYEFILDITYS
jgi:hypothetical protein